MATKQKPNRSPIEVLVPIDRSSDVALHEQVYAGVRRAIVDGKVKGGFRVPSTRMLAGQLGLSRNTVLRGFQQLHAEGYIEPLPGGGTYISAELPDANLVARKHSPVRPVASAALGLSRRHAALQKVDIAWTQPRRAVAFRLGVPAVDAFPFPIWEKLTAGVLKRRSPQLFAYGDPAGYSKLRSTIASYLSTARGVNCDPRQIIIVEGSQVALDLCIRVLLDPGDVAWIEDPGFPGAQAALRGNEIETFPVPIDGEGLDILSALSRKTPLPRLVYVTPSHQFPLGVAMTAARRLQLLDFASGNQSWIVEDDYLSEFRYAGRPLQALRGLDTSDRVIYIGTFSKMMFPAMRLGYLAVPERLVDAFVRARAVFGLHASSPTQAVLAEFMVEGHFVRHLRRMRALYLSRQQVLLKAAAAELGELLTLAPSAAGMHLVGRLAPGLDDQTVTALARAAGVETVALSTCYLGENPRSGLLLGYTGIRPPLLWRAARDLAAAMDPLRR